MKENLKVHNKYKSPVWLLLGEDLPAIAIADSLGPQETEGPAA